MSENLGTSNTRVYRRRGAWQRGHPRDGDVVKNGQNHINYVVRGTGDPTLIFVHGFACALDDWDEQLRGLSRSFRCVALDLPGHGTSSKPTTASIEFLAAAVNWMKHQVAASDTILIGHS